MKEHPLIVITKSLPRNTGMKFCVHLRSFCVDFYFFLSVMKLNYLLETLPVTKLTTTATLSRKEETANFSKPQGRDRFILNINSGWSNVSKKWKSQEWRL